MSLAALTRSVPGERGVLLASIGEGFAILKVTEVRENSRPADSLA